MTINKAGLELVKHFEGLRLEAYLDPVGIWTIGWGHTGSDVYPGQKITEKQAEALLAADLTLHEKFVSDKVTVKINANQLAALTSFAFNAGNGALASSTLLKKLNSGDMDGAAKEFHRWVKGTIGGVKKALPGLVRRRKAEAELFLSLPLDLATPKMEVSAVENTASALADFSGPAIPISLLGGDRDLVIAIQKSLTDLGYLDPPADGKFGPVSNWALTEFCNANGLSTGMGFTKEIADALVNPNVRLPDIAPSGTWFDSIVKYMIAQDYWICRHGECFNIVYVEGADPNGKINDDAINKFNDLRITFSIASDGVPNYTVWEGTTEPGLYWTHNPMNPKGAARIAFDQYKAWVVGTHLASKPSSAHEALVQVEDVTVYRDLNKDYMRTGDTTDTGLFGINQHWGYDAPKDNLGTTSAGCLVGRSKDGHREFMAMVKSDPRHQANKAYRFMAAIVPGDKALT